MSLAPQRHLAQPRTNWAGNHIYHATRLHEPRTIAEIQQIVAASLSQKALGSGHSFNDIADDLSSQISVKHLQSMELDAEARTVTVGGGVTYGKLAPYLETRGFALHNLASLPHISVAGACASATHGSGSLNGNLSKAVSSLQFVAADGSLQRLSRAADGDRFLGAVVHLGGLGMVTELTLDVQPTFQISQAVYQNLSMAHLEDHLEEIFRAGYSVSLFTDWQKHRFTQAWIKRRVDPGAEPTFAPEFFGATLAASPLHPLPEHSAENCTAQLGIPGPWYERLPHFRLDFTPSSGAEMQTEYFVPIERGYEAILAVEALCDLITPHLFVAELRTVAADDLWLSMAFQRTSLAFHFTWKPHWPEVQKILPLIEASLAPFDARPHWAKLFTTPAARLRQLYPRLSRFKSLLTEYDPQGKFRNPFLDAQIFAL